jgi:hypothetical protein
MNHRLSGADHGLNTPMRADTRHSELPFSDASAWFQGIPYNASRRCGGMVADSAGREQIRKMRISKAFEASRRDTQLVLANQGEGVLVLQVAALSAPTRPVSSRHCTMPK